MNYLIENFIRRNPDVIYDYINKDIEDQLDIDLFFVRAFVTKNSIKVMTKSGLKCIIKDVTIDQYNNFYCDFPKEIIPIGPLTIMRKIIVKYFELPAHDSYEGRAGRGLFIDYVAKYYRKLTIDEIVELCMIDKDYKKYEQDDDLYTFLSTDGHCFNFIEHISKKKYNEFLTKWKERNNA